MRSAGLRAAERRATAARCERPAPFAALQRSSARIALLLSLASLTFALAAGNASALVLKLPNGHTISYKPIAGAPLFSARARRARAAKNLTYHGGPVMPSNTNYAFYWAPAGSPAYPAEYQSGINEFFKNLAHDSGGVQNVDSVATQYGDSGGNAANYDSHFGGAIVDTDPYPANGCTAAPVCLTDEQLQAELSTYIAVHGLPHDLAHEYFILTPPGVENCAESTACSAGSSLPVYCAYHSFIPIAGGSIIYASDPYVTGVEGCDTGEHPNNKPSDGALQGGLSHEHNESITDPEVNAWYDSAGEENGDKCRTFEASSEYGAPIGTAHDGSPFNQVINGTPYWYQQEWSNAGSQCRQRLGDEPPTIKTMSPKKGPAAGGTTVTINGAFFNGATAVRFGAASASFTILSGGAIQAISPPGARGVVIVSVTTPAGTSAPVRKARFKYTR
jgi:IPT/TIG domain